MRQIRVPKKFVKVLSWNVLTNSLGGVKFKRLRRYLSKIIRKFRGNSPNFYKQNGVAAETV